MNCYKSISALIVAVFAAGTILTSCGPSAERVDAAKAKIETAEVDLIKAKEDYYKEYNEFKYKSDKQIADNTERIGELRKQSKKIKKEMKEEYERTINNLERKNDVLQSKIIEFKQYKKEGWQSFKREFSHDMAELSKSITDIGKNNVQ